MGNLNQFYIMGRVTKAPEVGVGADSKPSVTIALQPGTGGRAPRGPSQPLLLEACGPQVDAAKALSVGQSVLLRGQLRQEERNGASLLVARVQAIELLAGSEGRAPRGDDTSGRRRRRRGRGRGREPRAEGETAAPAGDGPPEGGAVTPPGPPPGPSAASTLPPPAPILPELAAPSPPPPESTPDMPF